MLSATVSRSPTVSVPPARAAGRRAFFQMPLGTLEWARLIALCLCLLFAFDLIAATSAANVARQHWQLALAGTVWLCWRWVRDYQQPRSSLGWTLLEAVALLLIGVGAGPDRAFALFFGSVCLRAAAGEDASVLLCLPYILSYAVALRLSSPPTVSAALGLHWLSQAGGLAATAVLVGGVAAFIRRQEQFMAGLSGLAAAERAVADERSPQRLYDAVLQAALGVVASPGATARLILGAGEQESEVAALGPSAEVNGATTGWRRFARSVRRSGGIAKHRDYQTPLIGPHGAEGTLVVQTPHPLSRACLLAVEVLATQTAIMLANVRLQEDMAHPLVDARYRSVVLSTSDLITIVGRDGRIRYQAPSVTPILGYRQPELIGKDLSALLHPEDEIRARRYLTDLARAGGSGGPIEWRLRHRDGAWRQVETIGTSLLHDPHIDGIMLTSRDIGDRKRVEQQLLAQDDRDALTGLANGALFGEHLGKVLHAHRFPAHGAAILFLDLDDFKSINDTLGRDAGDRLLRDVADRLRSFLRPGDLAARLGGDEFAILLDTGSRSELAPRVAERLLAVLRAPYVLVGQHVVISVSIGIAIAATSDDNPGTLLQRADNAVREAKQGGKGTFTVAKTATTNAA